MESTDPPASPCSTREFAAQITELSGNLNAANHRLLVLIAEFDRRNGWSDGVTKSCAHWLNWQCGLNLGAAREKVRVAHALEHLPKISAAMEDGRLSYAEVRAITRIADANTEEQFLQIALHGTAHHVEKLASQFRDVLEVVEMGREQKQQSQRSLHFSWEPDGALVIRARLPAETGALLLRAIERVVEEMPPAVPPEGQRLDAIHLGSTPSWSQRRADALVVVAESFSLTAPRRSRPVIGTRSWCTSMPGRCMRARRGAARSMKARQSPPRQHGDSRAMRASSQSSRMSAVSRSTSAARHARFRRRCAERSRHATRVVAFPAAPARGSSMGTT